MNNKELCHIWASREVKERKGRHLFFEKDIIYSYGYHFPIAKIYDVKGNTCVLFTSKGYSNTTAKHKNYVLGSISHYTVFTVPNVEINETKHKENIDYMLAELEENKEKMVRSRKYADSYMNKAIEINKDLIDYITFFGLGSKYKKVLTQLKKPLFSPAIIQEVKERIKKNDELEKQNRIKKEKELIEKLELWKAGENVNYSFYGLPVALRVKENQIESSRGAKVEIEEGRNLYKAIKEGKDINGQKIGYYTADRVENGILYIGCHEIDMQEVEKLAEALNWN